MIIFIPIVLSVILIATYFSIKVARKNNAKTKRIVNSRSRALSRITGRQFADTEPFNDPYCSSIDTVYVMEIDDKFDGRGKLTTEQIDTISLIFDGYRPGITQSPKNLIGACPRLRAGVPYLQSVFSDDNIVETIYPQFKESEILR